LQSQVILIITIAQCTDLLTHVLYTRVIHRIRYTQDTLYTARRLFDDNKQFINYDSIGTECVRVVAHSACKRASESINDADTYNTDDSDAKCYHIL